MTEEEKEGIVNDVMSRLIAQSVDLKHNDTYRNLYVKNLLRFDYQNDGGYIYMSTRRMISSMASSVGLPSTRRRSPARQTPCWATS